MTTLTNKRLSIGDLRDVLHYDPKSGLLTWTKRVARNVFAGGEAGSVDGQGYKHFQFKGCIYPCHQVAWALFHNEWPDAHVDHRDGDRANNRIENLREANQSQNCANRRVSPKNKVGLKGVVEKRPGRFSAVIWLGKSVHLGTFDTAEKAHAAYVSAAEKRFGEFARAA